MRLLIAWATCLATILYALPAMAQDQMTPLAAQGDWMAMSHSDSFTDPPDVCIAISLDGFGLRTDDTDNEVRYSDKSWSLPAGVTGTLAIKVNGKTYNLDITSNTDSMVAAEILTDQLQALVGEMNKASSMSVIAGTAAPATISLDGSNTVVAAYLTCANISPPSGETPAGANPFAGGSSQ